MSTTFTSDDDLLKHDTDGPNKKFRQAAKKVILANRFFSGRSSFRRVSVRDILQNTSLLAVDDTDDGDVTPTSIEPADNIDRAYDATTLKGKPDGLFRACMEAIRSLHHEARQIRTALILLGLFTDPELYKDWLAVFYIVNLELETKIKSKDFEESLGENENELSILNNLRKLGARYYFSELYEKDLQLLFGVSTRAKLLRKVESSLSNKPNAREYQIVVKTMTTASELAGAVFCLWGVFIVGKLCTLYDYLHIPPAQTHRTFDLLSAFYHVRWRSNGSPTRS